MPPKALRRQREETRQPGSKEDPIPIDDVDVIDVDEEENNKSNPIVIEDIGTRLDIGPFFERMKQEQQQQPQYINLDEDEDEELNIRTDDNEMERALAQDVAADYPEYMRSESDSDDDVEYKKKVWQQKQDLRKAHQEAMEDSAKEFRKLRDEITLAQQKPQTPPNRSSLLRSPRITREMMPQAKQSIDPSEYEEDEDEDDEELMEDEDDFVPEDGIELAQEVPIPPDYIARHVVGSVKLSPSEASAFAYQAYDIVLLRFDLENYDEESLATLAPKLCNLEGHMRVALTMPHPEAQLRYLGGTMGTVSQLEMSKFIMDRKTSTNSELAYIVVALFKYLNNFITTTQEEKIKNKNID